uniref:Uncharacterized protein n=1 Tax=Rhizophora mucronata TaxID=61149 RepID=A0A2P2KLK5_RHIMU
MNKYPLGKKIKVRKAVSLSLSQVNRPQLMPQGFHKDWLSLQSRNSSIKLL